MNLETSTRKYGRLAGFLYLAIALLGFFSIAYVPGQIIGDHGAETISNLRKHRTLFGLGVGADILTFMFEIVLTAMLYHLFKTVNSIWSTIAAFARLSMVVIMGLNLLIYVTPVFIINNPALTSSMDPQAQEQVVNILFNMHATGILIWGLFFGLHLILLGRLVIESSKHPTSLGLLMFIGSFGYILESLNAFVFSNNSIVQIMAIVLLAIVVIGEVGFAVWLVVKGIGSSEEPNVQSTDLANFSNLQLIDNAPKTPL